MTLGQRIQAGRNALELSQEGLGEKLGVSRQAVSKWEADAAVPDTDKLIALSKLFGMTLNELLQVEGPKETPEAETPAAKVPEIAPAAPLEGEETFWKRLSPEWKKLIAIALVILLIVIQATFRLRVTRLENRVEELERQISKVRLETGMESAWSSSSYGIDGDILHLSVSPTWEREGLEVVFEVVGSGAGDKRVQAGRQDNGDFDAEIWLGDLETPPYTVLAEFSYQGRQRTEPMLQLDRSFGKWVYK